MWGPSCPTPMTDSSKQSPCQIGSHLSACETMWFKLCKIKEAQLKISLYNTQSDSVLIADQN